MIYTVTFNPAVDVVVSVDGLKIGEINRTASQEFYYGGKGVNVSSVLRTLGTASTALGFLAGHIGQAMQGALASDGLDCDFIMLPAGETRVNTKLRSKDDRGALVETALNAGGPSVDEASLGKLFDRLQKAGEGDFVILSGGVHQSVGNGVYADILQQLDGKGVYVVVDATGDLLLNAVPHRPFLIKPNDEELAEIVGCAPDDRDALLDGARQLHDRGALNVLVSRGGDGALLVDEQGCVHEAAAAKGALVNSVGAGDSTVAGFVHGYLEARRLGKGLEDAYEHAFKLAMACGSATAFSEGLATKEVIDRLLA